MTGSSRALALLLALTVALAGVLAYEAQRATRSHRVTAERALHDYAAVAGWELMSATAGALDQALSGSLGPLLGTPAASPYDSLPQAGAIAGASAALLPCPAAGPHVGFAYDFRSATLTTHRDDASVVGRWLADSIAARGRVGRPAPGRAELVWNGSLVAVYGVKVLRYTGFAKSDVPMAAYGVVTCREALGPVLAGVVAEHPLLPASVAGGLTNRELVTLRVLDPSGGMLYESGPRRSIPEAETAAATGPGGLRVRASLPPAVAGRLLVESPRSRLPLLLGLLLLAAGLAAVAVRQLRREHELVRLRTDFTSSVSHELRTPLTQILLFAETLELGRAGGEDGRRQALGIIVQEARRLAHLVENVLQFSRAERRLLRIRPETVALAPLLREILERFAPLAGSAAVRLRTELDESIVARVHPDSLHQIVLNLLDNAVKHGGTGPIVLRSGLEHGWVRLLVDDHGPGVAPGDRERIWRPFIRVGGDGAPAGSGLGLAVVRELVMSHGGRCRVEESPGGGARVVVELPGGSRAAEARPGVEPARAPGGSA